MVKKRKIRSAYGVIYRQPWSPELHERGELAEFAREYRCVYGHSSGRSESGEAHYLVRAWDRFEQRWLCGNRIQWYAKKVSSYTSRFPLDKWLIVDIDRATSFQRPRSCLSHSTEQLGYTAK